MKEYISGLVTVGRNNTTAPRALAPAHNKSTSNPEAYNDGLPHEVCTINGGHAVGDSAKVRKDNARLARDIAIGHQVNMAEHVAKLSRRESSVISFMDDEARHLVHPYTDALVVTLNVAKGRVFRILIDTRSYANILFAFASRQMYMGGLTPIPIKTSLYGFGKERVYAEGVIQLPVTFGQLPA